MNESHAQYLLGLRARHAVDFEYLSRALAGRRPGLLRTLRKYHTEIDRETTRIFKVIDRREGIYERAKERP